MITSILVITVLEYISSMIYTMPACKDPNDKAEVAKMMAAMPSDAYLVVLLGGAIGCFSGGIVATLIAGRTQSLPALLVGVLAMVGAIANAFVLPGQPLWFNVINALICVPFAYIGFAVVSKKE